MPPRVRLARSIPRIETLALPWRPSLSELDPRRWLVRFGPTRRSLAVGACVLAAALGGYLVARETSLFSIDRIEVQGGPPSVAAQVRSALSSLAGRSLVGLDGSAVLEKVDALPTVVSASYDRAFPHTLRITIVPEQPAAVLRRGPDSWLVSRRARVIERLPAAALPRLPRIWIPAHTVVRTGAVVTGAWPATAARAVGLAGPLGARMSSATYTDGALVFRLRSGLEILLGEANQVKLKAAVAARLLPLLPTGSTYLDVSVPGRPVSGTGKPLQSSSRG